MEKILRKNILLFKKITLFIEWLSLLNCNLTEKIQSRQYYVPVFLSKCKLEWNCKSIENIYYQWFKYGTLMNIIFQNINWNLFVKFI